MPKILLLNQVAGPLFRELSEDLAIAFDGATLLSGHLEDLARKPDSRLQLIAGPDYDRKSIWRRLGSWGKYFVEALMQVARSDRRCVLFIVSNPPFLSAVGWIASILRGQKYCVLVYDVYPGVLVQLGRISRDGAVARLWRLFNRWTWNRAEVVFTIGDYMARNLRHEGGENSNVRVIPLWVDVDFIQPIPREKNSFVHSIGWSDRFIVLYSGNLGDSHNLDVLIDVADELSDNNELGFLIIGGGSRWSTLEKLISDRGMKNVKLLPFQPEADIPLTLPSGDVSVVSLESEVAGFMVPSKSYYYMAAGSSLLALMPPGNEVADMVEQGECGIRVDSDDRDGLLSAIRLLSSDKEMLSRLKKRSREIAENQYSRNNTSMFVEYIRPLVQTKS